MLLIGKSITLMVDRINYSLGDLNRITKWFKRKQRFLSKNAGKKIQSSTSFLLIIILLCAWTIFQILSDILIMIITIFLCFDHSKNRREIFFFLVKYASIYSASVGVQYSLLLFTNTSEIVYSWTATHGFEGIQKLYSLSILK